MNFNDFHFDKQTLSISKTYTRLNGKDIISEPKTPKSKRVISLSGALCNYIASYINGLYSYKNNERIFSFTKFFLKYEMNRVCKKSEVKPIRVHDLRHSHASLLIELSFTPLLISERLGHGKVETTLQTYSHLYPNKDTIVANTLNNLC